MSTTVSAERFSKVKWSLESWREVVLLTDKLLSWQQDWYAGVVAGLVSLAYLMVWYWDPTFLTFFAFSGLFLTLADYMGPKIVNQVFGADSWTGAKEKHFELVCQKLTQAFESAESSFQFLRDVRGSKPVAHFVVTLIALFSVAWIGNKVNNFFLAYLVTLFVALLPGLVERGLLQKFLAQVTLKLAELYKGKEQLHKKAE